MSFAATAIAISVLSAGVQIRAQQQAAQAQAKAQRNATIAEQQRLLQEMSSMRLKEQQENIAAAQRVQVAGKKAEEARATARVSAGEAGVAGLSIDALINDFTREEAEYRYSVTQQQEFTNVNRDLQMRDAQLGSTMNLLRINKPIQRPDFLGSALRGASTGLSIARAGQEFTGGATPSSSSTSSYTYNPSAFNTGIEF